jgi:hypothetical protein
MTQFRVGFAIFGCLTIPKYKQQVVDVYSTWASTAIKRGCPVKFFVGDIPDDSELDPQLLELCVNVGYGDSYLSATYKQWVGLCHLYECLDPCNFYFTAGTDTFVCVDRFLSFLKSYIQKEPLLIGSGNAVAQIASIEYSYFSGGAGLCLNRKALTFILPHIGDFLSWYLDAAAVPVQDRDGVIRNHMFACDLQLVVLCQNQGVELVQISESLMLGSGNHKSAFLDKAKFLTCHHMSHEDFYDVQSVLTDESF